MSVPAHSRVVEVLQLVGSRESDGQHGLDQQRGRSGRAGQDDREGRDGRDGQHWELGSGYLIGGSRVLTASHVVRPGEIVVRRVDGEGVKASWSAKLELECDPEFADFAILTLIGGPDDMPPAEFVRVDLDDPIAEVLERCTAIGFARYKNEGTAPDTIKRRMAHVYGEIPVLDAFGDGLLTLHVARPPQIVQAQIDAGISPFKGMSGAAVTVRGQVIGVVRDHPRNEAGSLVVSPLTLLGKLDHETRARWKAALGADPALLPTLSASGVRAAVRAVPPAAGQVVRPGLEHVDATALVLPDLVSLSRSSAMADAREADVLGLMIDDIGWMRDTYALEPDLILVPGCLVRSPTASAYREARRTLDLVCSALGVAGDRVVVAPGAQDVNPRLYEDVGGAWGVGRSGQSAYMASVGSMAKWDGVFAMVDELSGTEVAGRLTRERPWAWREFAEQKLAIAVLNSTVYDTGKADEHRGRLGKPQLDQLAGPAAARAAEGWLCLGLIYDAPTADDESALVDAASFLQRIGVHLYLVVHGRPRSYIDRVSSAGSTTVIGATDHPDGSYQILGLGPRPMIWGRRYDPYRGEWTGDTDIGGQPNTWSRQL